MDFSFFSKLDELHKRLMLSAMCLNDSEEIIGDKRRERMISSIFAEVRIQKRQFRKECRHYSRFVKKVEKENKRVQKRLVKNEKKKEKKQKNME